MSVITFTLTIALWVFFLAKHLSTHKVKILDLKQSATQKRPVESKNFDPDEDGQEEELKDFASSVTAQMFNRNKERLTDSLNGR